GRSQRARQRAIGLRRLWRRRRYDTERGRPGRHRATASRDSCRPGGRMASHGQPGAPERPRTMTNGRRGLVAGTGEYVYDVISPWGVLPAGMTLGIVSHVAVDSRDRVYFYQRKDPPMLVFDRDGNFLTGWGEGRLRDAHGIYVGPDDHIYVCNRDEHEVLKLTPEGRIVLTLGQRGRRSLGAPFTPPADVAVAPNVGYFATSVVQMAWDAWRFGERANGVLAVPLWIPQSGMALGLVVLTVAFVDEWVRVLRL